jgi:uncharacterized protein (DUF885 family)
MGNQLFWNLLFVGVILIGCVQRRPHFDGSSESEQLRNYLAWSYKTFLERTPEEMTYMGMQDKQDQLNQYSYAFDVKTHDLARKHLRILRSFDRDSLNDKDRLSYDLYQRELQKKIDSLEWRDYRYPVRHMFSVQTSLPGFMLNIHRVNNEQDLQNYILRLGEFKRVFAETVNNLMRSETRGVVLPRFAFDKTIADSRAMIVGRPFDSSKKDSPIYKDFNSKLKSLKLSKAKEQEYRTDAIQALKNSVKPGFSNLVMFLEKQKLRASNDDGAWKLPRGEEYYQYQLKKMTTLDMNPEEIHQLGLKNVERIHSEMRAIAKKVKFKGDLQAFFNFMKSDRFFFKDNPQGKKSYLQMASRYIDQMETKLDGLFMTKPKASIDVKAVEPFREKSAGMAFYQKGTPDGKRPGTYYVNLYNMKALPQWEAEALAYHEGIPGHHMQLSIAQELENVPEFRKSIHYTSYVEGWGLYSERIPKELGFYKDPYSDFGRLSMELTRACRLVVDTGIHYKKWTRAQAIAYLDKNLPGDHFDNVRQIGRYIVWPGQATAYMVGMLKILELREKAKKQMGQKFDIKKFHDVILTSGAVPLDILEDRVNGYIKGA